MNATWIPSAVLIFTGSLALGCAGGSADDFYRPVSLSEWDDPLVPREDFPAWKPPKQFAVFIHPHEDVERQTLVGGHWMMILLSEGSWYHSEDTEQEPVPDAEASPEEIRKGLSALARPGEAVVPTRPRNE